MKALAIVAGVALVAVVGDIVLLLRQPAVIPLQKAVAPVEAQPVAPTANVVRAQIQQAVVAERPKLRSPRDVESYLDDLKVRARRNHRVGALEVEPGIAAIVAQYDPEHVNERIRQFSSEMAQLSAELDRPPAPPDIEVLARNIERAADENSRQDFIRGYVQAVQSLPPEDQTRRMAWLNQQAGAHP